MFVHLKFKDKDGILILEKTPFNQQSLSTLLKDRVGTRLNMNNDIYKTFELYLRPDNNGRAV